mgnify:CR=1 FL=1
MKFFPKIGLLVFLCLGGARLAPAQDRTVLRDEFAALPVGLFSSDVGPLTEYHYLPDAAPKGNWTVACFYFGPGWGQAWEVIQRPDGRHAMRQNLRNKTVRHTHPMLSAGDVLWRNYRVGTQFTLPADSGGRAGLVVRYQTNRRYYFVGVEGGRAWIKKIAHETSFRVPNETTLASLPLHLAPGAPVRLEVTVNGPDLEVRLNGSTRLRATDGSFPAGKIALLADQPAVFESVRVDMTEAAWRKFRAEKQRRDDEERALQARNPAMKLWKKLSTKGFGVGRNLRFGDLNGDGRTDILIGQVHQHAAPFDSYAELSCLTALDLDGTVLWQVGTPDPTKTHLTNDVAFQIHDWDGDGKNEVVYTMNFEIVVADGATGKTRLKVPTPQAKPPALRFPCILGDCIAFADFQGRGRKGDLIIKDRYRHFWVYDNALNPVWSGDCNTGHYPFPYDADGDGRDELFIGYSRYGPDGRRRWTLDSTLNDHADAVVVVPQSDPAREPLLLYAASDDGLVMLGLDGKIQRHQHWGHCQNVTVADFRPDLPGLEIALINFWGNQGTTFLLNERGEAYREFELLNMGSLLLPVNWTGQPGEFFLTNPNPTFGGLYDGWGRRVVAFPDDGHPDLCNAVLDLTGDACDEIVVWNPDEIWIYTQADSPLNRALIRPVRNPLFNESNYRAMYSGPGR